MKDAMNRNISPATPNARPVLMAAGSLCLLLANPASAVELGAIEVQSALGQPLRASIAYALAPNETINDQCVYLNAASPAAGLPSVSRASATINGQRIMLRGDIPLREPMMTLELAVNCPYTAKLKREYLLLLNPATADSVTESVTTEQAPVSAPVFDARRPVNTFVAPQQTAARRTSAPVVEVGSEYRVRVGDTLSEIAARVPDRKVGLWNAVNRIYEANPNAFLNNNIDQLIAGVTLQIPSSVTDAQSAGSASAAAQAPQNNRDRRARAYNGAAESQATAPAVVDAPPVVAPVTTSSAEPAATATATSPVNTVEAPVSSNNATIVEPVIEAEPPASSVAAPQATVSIPDTSIVQQPVPVASADNENATSSWLVWLGGTGIALFLALLLFGRRLRDKFGSTPEEIADLDETQVSDAVHRHLEDPGVIEVTETFGPAAGLKIANAGSEEAILDTGDDIDVALDYSFASSGDHSDELDFVVDSDETPEVEAVAEETPVTAAAAAPEEDDYDMSMVLDVTKQDFQAPGPAVDELKATEVSAEDTPTVNQTGARDLTSEFDYRILEQDYEDELTATQALSREVEEAARDLQKRLADVEPDTSQISMAQDLEATAEITAEMPKRALANDAQDTVEMPRDNHAAPTVEMPRDQNLNEADETDLTEALAASMAEMEIDDDDETAVLDLDETANQRQSKAS